MIGHTPICSTVYTQNAAIDTATERRMLASISHSSTVTERTIGDFTKESNIYRAQTKIVIMSTETPVVKLPF